MGGGQLRRILGLLRTTDVGIIIGALGCLVGVLCLAVACWGVRVSQAGVKVSENGVKIAESSRLDTLSARLDTFAARIDGADRRDNDLEHRLGKVRDHEKKMLNLANQICERLLAEEEARAKTLPGNRPQGPSKYIQGTPISAPNSPERFQTKLCSQMPAEPDF